MDRKLSPKIFILGIIWFGEFNVSLGDSLCDISLWYSKQTETGIFHGELTHDQRSVQLIAEDLIRKSEHIPHEKYIDCGLLDKYEILLWGTPPSDGVHSDFNLNEVDESEIDETEMFEEDEDTMESTAKQQEITPDDVKNNEQQNSQQERENNMQQGIQEKEIDDSIKQQQVSEFSGVNNIEHVQEQEGEANVQQEKQNVETKEIKNIPITDKQERVIERKAETIKSRSDDFLDSKESISESIGEDTNDNIRVNEEEAMDETDDKNVEDTDTKSDTKQEISKRDNVIFGYCRTGMTAMLDVFDLMMKQDDLYSYRPRKQICPQFTARRNLVYSPSACLTEHASYIYKAENDQKNLSESKEDIEKDKSSTLSNDVGKEKIENNNILKKEITSNAENQQDSSQIKQPDGKREKGETQESVSKNNESKQREMRRTNEAEDAARNLKEYFNRKSDEYSIKIQSLEITLMKLQNQVLMEKIEKQNHTSTITRLENHILKLENELLKINQSYYTLKSENEAMDRRQRKYLELGHTGAKEQDSKHYEIISKQQEKIAQLKEILNNQTSAIDKIRLRSDYLEDQNRMLYQMVMNQTTLMSQIMSRVQSLTEENIKQREEARQLKEEMNEKLIKSSILHRNQKIKIDQESNQLLNNLNILTADNQELKIKSSVQLPLKPVINYRWCGKKAVNCLSEITASVICSPLSSFQWAQCDTMYFNIKEDPPVPNANVEITQKQDDYENAEKDTYSTPGVHAQSGEQHLPSEKTQHVNEKNMEKLNKDLSDEKQQKPTGSDEKSSETQQAPDLPDPKDIGEEQVVSKIAQTGEQIKDQSGQEHADHRPILPTEQEQSEQTKNQEAVIEQTINKQTPVEVTAEQDQTNSQEQDQAKQLQDENFSNRQPLTKQNDQVPRKTETQPVEQNREKQIQNLPSNDQNGQNINTEHRNNQIREQQLTSEQNQESTQKHSEQEKQVNIQQEAEQTAQDKTGQKENEDKSQQQTKEDEEQKQPKQDHIIQEQNNKEQSQNKQQNEQKIQQQNQMDNKLGKQASAEDKPSNKETQNDEKGQATQRKATTKVQRKPLLYSNLEQREPKDCYDHYINRGSRKNGAYKIRPMGQTALIEVFCDMKNGGWTIIQKRQDGTTNFYRDWKDYKEGFGGVYGEQWIGLDYLHHMTNQEYYTLRIDLTDWKKETKIADYDYFLVDDENEGYRLHIGEYSGDAGDGMGKHNLHKFSTKDVDNDKIVKEFGGSCAKRFSGAWWYYKCYMSNLNGKYYRGGKIPEKKFDGITWKPWTGPNYSMKIVVMKIRPNSAK